MSRLIFVAMLILAVSSVFTSVFASESKVEEVVVEAMFFEQSANDISSSISVLGQNIIDDRQAVHLEDVLNIIPNVNFSSGASRGRFFQIRGIGERSEFVDPINPSVGLIIDGIDFSGIGGAATTFDVKQIEVLRGPQGTLYGANALAGLINIVSNSPDQAGGETRLTVGEFNTREFSQVISGPVSDSVSMRLGFSKSMSDGYINNTYLNRDDTNSIDETTFRSKIHWQANDDTLVKLTGFFADTDNGYDAFSLDNTRETLSDEPGRDTLQTRAGSLIVEYDGFTNTLWETVFSAADTDTEYGYDEDWTYSDICSVGDPCEYWSYSSVDNYERNKKNMSFDSRLVSTSEAEDISWLAGIYLRDESNDLLRTYTYSDLFNSEYESDAIAFYGQLNVPVSNALTLNMGMRLEQREWDYVDSDDEQRGETEDFWGGKLALEYRTSKEDLFYALISRGYKAGGTNVRSLASGPAVDLIPLIFDTETMVNYEIGHKASWLEGKLETSLAVFYQDRNDMQVKQSLVTSEATGELNGDCPCEFTDYFGNVSEGVNYGLEVELVAYLTESLEFWLNAGLLETEFRDFQNASHADVDPANGAPIDMDGRDQAHAPNYQAAMGLEYKMWEHLSLAVSAEFKDEFYLSPRHNEKTESYELLNARLTYSRDNWEVALWGKNLTDEDTIVRGFGSFGNDPRQCDNSFGDGGENCYPTEPFYQFGTPRVVGLSARLNFE